MNFTDFTKFADSLIFEASETKLILNLLIHFQLPVLD